MKIASILATVGLISLATLTNASMEINNEFIKGFEQGIQIGESGDIKEFGCPQPHLAGPLGNLQQVLMPLKLMGSMVKDQNIETLISTVDVFVNSVSSLMAVFSGYEGDDFCSGIIFGKQGSHMLINIAKTLVVVKKNAPKASQTSITQSGGNTTRNNSNIKKGSDESSNAKKPNFRRNNWGNN